MKAWIQSSDFSSKEFDLDAAEATHAFTAHDWSRENAQCAQLESEGKEFCEPGLGLVRSDGQILHICPDDDSAMVHWHKPVRVLGFLWRSPRVESFRDYPLADVGALIEAFYREDDVEVEKRFAGVPVAG